MLTLITSGVGVEVAVGVREAVAVNVEVGVREFVAVNVKVVVAEGKAVAVRLGAKVAVEVRDGVDEAV
jgi:hypothetical protein